MINFQKVTKEYGTGQKALDNIDIQISSGEFVFLIGDSGAGKTTLLRLIIRDLSPTTGKIFVDKLNIAELKSSKIARLRQFIGMIFQDFKILEDRTAFENVALPLQILGEKEDAVKNKVYKMLEMVELKGKENLFPIQLSAGEQQRVGLARAVINEPKIVLADEPTGNLDPKTSWEIIDLLRKINKKGHTVIIATHDQDIVNSLKGRVISLKQGKVASDKNKGKYL